MCRWAVTRFLSLSGTREVLKLVQVTGAKQSVDPCLPSLEEPSIEIELNFDLLTFDLA